MLTLQFELEFQKINLVNRWETVATDSKNYLVARFDTLSDDWTMPITAIFTNDKDEQPYAVVVGADSALESNECYVPWEVLKDESNVYVSAYCGNLHTTVTAAFHVYKSGYTDGETPPPPSPTVYDAIMQAITDLQNGKQDKLTAGENITISSDNVISADGGLSDYTDLENKPSINNVTLSGNKSSDDLNLQGKLTAGNNITINNGVISASGGVTSYNDLTDKPILENYSPNQRETNHTLSGTISFYPFTSTTTNGKTYFRLDDVILFKCGGNATISDFNSTSFIPNGAYSCFVTNHPSFMNAKYDLFVIYNFKYPGTNGLAQLVFWVDNTTNEAKSAFRVGAGTSFTGVSDWTELTGGGSQIVSGVVNANGTITFTDSDGNTFTTTGSSVIGADGIGIADVHIDGGGDLIIEYTTGHMENIGHVVGADGQDYVLTAQDKSDIADIVLSELPTTQGVQYGN